MTQESRIKALKKRLSTTYKEKCIAVDKQPDGSYLEPATGRIFVSNSELDDAVGPKGVVIILPPFPEDLRKSSSGRV